MDIGEAADEIAKSLAGATSFFQIFVESSRELRREISRSSPVDTGYTVRCGVGILVQHENRWKHLARPIDDINSLARWVEHLGGRRFNLETVHTVSPLHLQSQLDSDAIASVATVNDNRTLRFVEDISSNSVALLDSDGRKKQTSRSRARRRAFATTGVDGQLFEGRSRAHADGVSGVWESDASPRFLSHAASAQAASMSVGRSFGDRQGPVLFTNASGVAFLHELIGHGLEADNLAMPGPFSRHLTKSNPWIPNELELIDDPTCSQGFGFALTDDEGNPAESHHLVSGGLAVGALASKRHESPFANHRGGQGRRASYRYPALPRASTTLVRRGTESALALTEQGAEGLLVVSAMGGGHVNILTGEYSFTVTDATFISPGGAQVPVSNVRLRGDALTSLNQIEAIGDDFHHDSAICGKNNQEVPIGLSGPSIRFGRLAWSS